MEEEMLTVTEVATLLRISTATVKKMAGDGRLPAIKIGRQWRFRKVAIDEFIKQQEGIQRTG